MRRYAVKEGIVIRRRPLPSGDLVVTLLSSDGKWRAVARKGKLPGGNLGRLSLFHDVTVQYYRRRDEDLALITQVQLGGALVGLSRPDVYPYASLLAELADALTVDVHLGERLHEYLASGLRGLVAHHDPEQVALVYAWRLLGLAGLSPVVSRCVSCGARTDLTAFDAAAGGLSCAACAGGTVGGPLSEMSPTLAVGPDGAADLRSLTEAPVRTAVERTICSRMLQWRLLRAHVAHHVHLLNSLGSLPAPTTAQPAIPPSP